MSKNSHPSPFVLLLSVLCCALEGGCGDGRPATVPVQGQVTWKGEPVRCGTIVFQPEKGRMAHGRIGPDGSYSLTTFDPDDGAIVGKHNVTIEAVEAASEPEAPTSFEEELQGVQAGGGRRAMPKMKWLVPNEYARAETSPLTVEVHDSSNVINFSLPQSGR